MTGIRIPSLPPIVAPDGDDLLPIEDVSTSTTKKITLTQIKEWFQSLVGWITAGMLGTNACTRNDGWISTADTWVYVAPNQFKIVGVDRTAIYKKSTRLKWTQTTVKYGVLGADSVMSGSDTLVTIVTNTDYTIANAAITANYYSYCDPADYPGTFNYNCVPTVSGGTAPSYSIKIAKFQIDKNHLTAQLIFQNASGGTAGSGTAVISVPLPVTAVVTGTHGTMRVYNGGTLISSKIILDCSAVDINGNAFYMSSEGYNIIGNDQNNANRYMQMNLSYII